MKRSSTATCMLLFLTGLLFSCNGNEGQARKSGGQDSSMNISKPPPPQFASQQLQKQVNTEVRQALSVTADSSGVKEAAEVVAETHNAVRYLLDSNFTAATRSIETAIGKAEILTSTRPNMAFVPLETDVVINDLVTDLETLKRIRSNVEDLTDKGYLQDARRLLADLSSEIQVATQSIPMATYPTALKTAASLARERKAMEAALVLSAALNTLVIEERDIPLPLVRAEAMLAVADSLISSKNQSNNDAVNTLLDNADYQIRFAEALGYGKKDREFKELYDAIRDLKSEVKKSGSRSPQLMQGLRNKLRNFKARISPKTRNRQQQQQQQR